MPSGVFDLRGAERVRAVRRAPRGEKTPLGAVHRRPQQEVGEICGLEVHPIAVRDDRIIEVHPEVSFCAMKGRPLLHPKKSWNGQMERRSLLHDRRIEIPDLPGEPGKVPPDDVLDAAAASWTAWRVATGGAKVFPASLAGFERSQREVIWY